MFSYVYCYVKRKALLQCLWNYWEEGYGPVWGAFVYVFVGFCIFCLRVSFVMYFLCCILYFLCCSVNGYVCLVVRFLQCLWPNNLQYFWVWLLFCCWMLWRCWVWMDGYGDLGKNELCVFGKLCPVGSLVVC